LNRANDLTFCRHGIGIPFETTVIQVCSMTR
jgi:hypothetical protein